MQLDLMEDVTNEAASDLPEGWTRVTVGDLLPDGGIFDGPFGSKLKTKDYTPSGSRVVRLENVGHLEFIGEKTTYVSPEKHAELERHTVGEGDIIFASFVDKEVRVCRLPEIGPAIAKADCFCLRPDDERVDPDLLVYFLAARQSYTALAEAVHGATRPRVNTTHVKSLSLGLPPLPEQRRIVARLDAIEVHRRAAKEKLDQLPELLDRYRQSVLAAAFRGDLTAAWREAHPDTEPASVLLERIRSERRRRWIEDTARKATDRAQARDAKKGQTWTEADRAARLDKERAKAAKKYTPPEPVDTDDLPDLPDGWCWTTLAEATAGDTDYRGKTPPKNGDGDIPLISSAAVKRGRIVEGPSGYITRETYNDILVRGVPSPGDVVVTTEAPVGEAALFPDVGTYMLSRRVIAFAAHEAEPLYLMNSLYTEVAQRHIRKWGRGSTVPRILKPHLEALPVALAPLAEQAEVVRLVRIMMERTWRVRAHGLLLGERVEQLRQATLARAFRGELVPTDAELARRSADREPGKGEPQVAVPS